MNDSNICPIHRISLINTRKVNRMTTSIGLSLSEKPSGPPQFVCMACKFNVPAERASKYLNPSEEEEKALKGVRNSGAQNIAHLSDEQLEEINKRWREKKSREKNTIKICVSCRNWRDLDNFKLLDRETPKGRGAKEPQNISVSSVCLYCQTKAKKIEEEKEAELRRVARIRLVKNRLQARATGESVLIEKTPMEIKEEKRWAERLLAEVDNQIVQNGLSRLEALLEAEKKLIKNISKCCECSKRVCICDKPQLCVRCCQFKAIEDFAWTKKGVYRFARCRRCMVEYRSDRYQTRGT